MGDPSRFRFGPFELDLGTFQLLRDTTVLPVEPKALDVLRVLVERAPHVVDKAEIFSLVWKDVAVTDNALTRLVAQLRKLLGDDPKAAQYIETVATRGYRFIADVTIVTRPVRPSNDVSAELPLWRRRTWLAVGAVVLAAIALTSAWRLFLAIGSNASSASASNRPNLGTPDVAMLAALRPQQVIAGRGYDGFLAFAPDGQSIAYSSDQSGALEIYVQGTASGSTATALTANGRHNVQPSWSPDGQFIAYHEMSGGGIWIVPSRGGVPRKLSNFGSHPVWSPDGRRLAFQSLPTNDINGIGIPGALSTIWIVEVTANTQPTVLTKAGDPAGPHLMPAWSKDSRHVFFAASSSLSAGGGTTLWSVDIDGGQRRLVAASPRLSPEYAIAPNERALYFVARGTNAIWWLPLDDDAETSDDGRPTGVSVVGSAVAHLAISADGRRMAWTGLDSSTHLWATETGRAPSAVSVGATALTQGFGVRFALPALATDGRLALVGSRPGSNSNLFLITAGAAPRQLTVEPGNHGGPQWMPGEREIAFVEDHDKVAGFSAIDPDTGRTRRLFQLSEIPKPPGESQPSTAAPAVNIVFARDFSRLALTIVREGRPNVWVAALKQFRPDGTLVQRTFEREGGSYPIWSPDGRWIAYQCYEGTDTHVCIVDGERGERIQLTHDPGQSWAGGWTADNDRVLFAAKRGAVWNVASVSRSTSAVQQLTRFTEPRGYVRYPRWDPANNRVVFERAETTGRVWSIELP